MIFKRIAGAVVLALLFSSSGFCVGRTYAQWGISFQAPAAVRNNADIKFVEFGRQAALTKTFDQRIGVGGWEDSSNYPGARNSLYAHYSVGLEPNLKTIYVYYFLGLAGISTTDTELGSNLQLIQNFGVGVKDFRDVRVGFLIKHLSNGGAARPNIGRNFVGIEVQF